MTLPAARADIVAMLASVGGLVISDELSADEPMSSHAGR